MPNAHAFRAQRRFVLAGLLASATALFAVVAIPTTADDASAVDAPAVRIDPPLNNAFLTRQGATIPPLTCLAGSNAGTFAQKPDAPVTQQVAAFDLSVEYDETRACVRVVPGPAAAGMACTVQDDANALLRDLARISCAGAPPDTNTPEGRHLATIIVQPQPDVYSAIRPNYRNGVVVPLTVLDCSLRDVDGALIPLAGCSGAAVTLRYLEGDVAGPDCAVTTLDIYTVASRLGARIGSARYSAFYDLQPSPRGDGDIDILDVQFVSGRYGSTCATPHPPQPPLTPG